MICPRSVLLRLLLSNLSLHKEAVFATLASPQLLQALQTTTMQDEHADAWRPPPPAGEVFNPNWWAPPRARHEWVV